MAQEAQDIVEVGGVQGRSGPIMKTTQGRSGLEKNEAHRGNYS